MQTPLKGACAKVSTDGTRLSVLDSPTGEVLKDLRVVQASPEHRSFILATWVKSYRPTARKLGFEEFYNEYEPKVAERYWGDCKVVTDEDGFTVYAWICGLKGKLFHVYVIPALRHIGVASSLAENVCGESYRLARPWPGHPRPGKNKVDPYLLLWME